MRRGCLSLTGGRCGRRAGSLHDNHGARHRVADLLLCAGLRRSGSASGGHLVRAAPSAPVCEVQRDAAKILDPRAARPPVARLSHAPAALGFVQKTADRCEISGKYSASTTSRPSVSRGPPIIPAASAAPELSRHPGGCREARRGKIFGAVVFSSYGAFWWAPHQPLQPECLCPSFDQHPANCVLFRPLQAVLFPLEDGQHVGLTFFWPAPPRRISFGLFGILADVRRFLLAPRTSLRHTAVRRAHVHLVTSCSLPPLRNAAGGPTCLRACGRRAVSSCGMDPSPAACR